MTATDSDSTPPEDAERKLKVDRTCWNAGWGITKIEEEMLKPDDNGLNFAQGRSATTSIKDAIFSTAFILIELSNC